MLTPVSTGRSTRLSSQLATRAQMRTLMARSTATSSRRLQDGSCLSWCYRKPSISRGNSKDVGATLGFRRGELRLIVAAYLRNSVRLREVVSCGKKPMEKNMSLKYIAIAATLALAPAALAQNAAEPQITPNEAGA